MHVARANLLTPLQCDPPSAGLRMTGATCLTYPHLIATNYYPLRDTLSIFVQLLGCQIDLDNRRCMYLLALSAPLALTTAAITSSNHSPSHLYSRIINHKCVYSRMHTWRAFSFPNKWPLILSISRFIGNSSYCGGQSLTVKLTATPLLQCRSPYIAILLNLTTIITCFVKFYWNSVQSKPWTLFFLEKLILIWNLQIGSMRLHHAACMTKKSTTCNYCYGRQMSAEVLSERMKQFDSVKHVESSARHSLEFWPMPHLTWIFYWHFAGIFTQLEIEKTLSAF